MVTIKGILLRKSLAALLIFTIAIPIAPLARAQSPSGLTHSPQELEISYSIGVPYDGALDLKHGVRNSRNSLRLAMYALRTTAVEDLLNTRKALKYLLGGTARATKIVEDEKWEITKWINSPDANRVSFKVPRALRELYQVSKASFTAEQKQYLKKYPSLARGKIPTDVAQMDLREQQKIATLFSKFSQQIPEIVDSIVWLDKNEPAFDQETRDKLTATLVETSVKLTEIDQTIRYFTHDIWENNTISREFRNQHCPRISDKNMARTASESEHALENEFKRCNNVIRKNWLKDVGIADEIKTQQFIRTEILSRYLLLNKVIDGRPFYQKLYESLEVEGFPKTSPLQKAEIEHLPSGTIPYPTKFSDAANKILLQMNYEAADSPTIREIRKSRFDHIASRLNRPVDQILLQALDENTDELKALADEVDFTHERDSRLLTLARSSEFWRHTAEKFAYLDPIIRFDRVKYKLDQYFKYEAQNKKDREVIMHWATGIGLGVIAVTPLGPLGVLGEGLVAGVGLLTAGTGLAVAKGAWNDADTSKASALVAKTLFNSKYSYYTSIERENAILMSEEDTSNLYWSIILLGGELSALRQIKSLRTFVKKSGKVFVQISAEELASLRSVVKKALPRSKMVPYGRQLLKGAETILSGVVERETLISLHDAIPLLARRMQLTTQEVTRRIYANPQVSAFITKFKGTPFATRAFWAEVAEENAVGMVTGLTGEWAARGDRMGEEWLEVTVDMLGSMLMNVGIVYQLFKPQYQVAASNLADFGARYRTMIPGFAAVGASAQFSASSIVSAIEEYKHPEDKDFMRHMNDIIRKTIFGTLHVGLSSNLRYNIIQSFKQHSDLGKMLMSKTGNTGAKWLILQGIRFSNNVVGSWSYVKLSTSKMTEWAMEPLGLGKPPISPDENGFYFRVSPVSNSVNLNGFYDAGDED